MQEDETRDTTAGINIWIHAYNSCKAKVSQNQAVKTQQFLWFISWSDMWIILLLMPGNYATLGN